MLEYACTRDRSSSHGGTSRWTIIPRSGGEPTVLKVLGRSGAIVETPARALSFRAGGEAPTGRVRWRPRFRHDVSIVAPGTMETIAEFRVSPLRRTLTFSSDAAVFHWKVAFLARRAVWDRDGHDAANIRLAPLFVNAALVRVAEELGERQRDVLVSLGLYLLVTGR